MKGFIVDSTYRIINDKPYVFLFGRLENQETFAFIKHFKPYFFIKEADLKKAELVEDFDSEKVSLKDFDGKKVVKILVDKPSDVVHVRDAFHDANISTYEADIRYAQRFILDNKLRSSVDISGDYEYQDDIRVYKDAEIKPADWLPELNVLSLDIETNAKTGEIYVISVATDKVKKAFANNCKVKNAEFCNDESEVIERFAEAVREIDPDVITGWNLIDFDLKQIQERAKEHKIDVMLGRDSSKMRLRIVSDFLKNSTAFVAGRVVVDALNLIKSSFIKLDDYKLETAAQEFLGKGKLLKFKNIAKHEEIDRMYMEEPAKLVDYNLLDAVLPLEILKASGALALAIQKSFLTGITLDRASASIASLDSLYLPAARERGLVCSTVHYNVKERGITGGFVMEPKPGIYDNIIVLDFKSLYPSIIKTFNIDPASFVKSCRGKNLVKAPNGACFRNEEGILPGIITELWQERENARKEKNELARYAIKILMNSFFGSLANPNCRFFSMKVANAITHFGQHLLKMTRQIVEKKGYEVIYGDTDACFVRSKAKSVEEAEKIGRELELYINNYYDKHIKKEYNRESFLEMEYEKCYSKFLMPKLRKSALGAKKRYAGLLNGKVDITGLEAVRGDWTKLARQFQQELLLKLFKGDNLEKYIRSFVAKLRKGKLDDLLVYSKSLRKPLKEYVKTTPPHVKAARKLDSFKGKRIDYIITDEGPEPVEKLRHSIDYEHYIKKQLKPIADSILIFLNSDFEDVLKGNKQESLASFS